MTGLHETDISGLEKVMHADCHKHDEDPVNLLIEISRFA